MIKRHSSHMLPLSLQHKVAGANERAGCRGAAWKHLADDDEPVGSGMQAQANVTPVSYTHLTLPTNREV